MGGGFAAGGLLFAGPLSSGTDEFMRTLLFHRPEDGKINEVGSLPSAWSVVGRTTWTGNKLSRNTALALALRGKSELDMPTIATFFFRHSTTP